MFPIISTCFGLQDFEIDIWIFRNVFIFQLVLDVCSAIRFTRHFHKYYLNGYVQWPCDLVKAALATAIFTPFYKCETKTQRSEVTQSVT